MRAYRVLTFGAFLVAIHCLAAELTNLASWESISNRWSRVPFTNAISAASAGDANANYFVGRTMLERTDGVPRGDEALKYISNSAALGSAEAQNRLSWMFLNGIFVPTDFKAAIHWAEKSAAQGYPKGTANLGTIYELGLGVPIDLREAEKWFRKSSDAGNAQGKVRLAALLKEHPNLARGRFEPATLMREAANAGDPFAQNEVGQWYFEPESGEPDFREARKWFKKSGEQGFRSAVQNLYRMHLRRQDDRELSAELAQVVRLNAERGAAWAQHLWGDLHLWGTVVPKNTNVAVEWIQRSADQKWPPAIDWIAKNISSNPLDSPGTEKLQRLAIGGSAEAQYQLAMHFLRKPTPDSVLGMKWLHVAATNKHYEAQFELAQCYDSGNGVATNKQIALHWYAQVANTPNRGGSLTRIAMTRVGIILATGEGVPRQDSLAFKWFQALANGGARDALDTIGMFYLTGRGVAVDEQAALESFELGSNVDGDPDSTGFPPALHNLGVMYLLGRGVKTNPLQAVDLFKRAIDNQSSHVCSMPQSKTALAICFYNGKGVEKNPQEALRLFSEAARDGDSQAQFHLGLLYFSGEGVARDAEKAYAWFYVAAEQKELHAAYWREQAAKQLTSTQRDTALKEVARVPRSLSFCLPGIGGVQWLAGLRLPNIPKAQPPEGASR